jgi:hypothetical protein
MESYKHDNFDDCEIIHGDNDDIADVDTNHKFTIEDLVESQNDFPSFAEYKNNDSETRDSIDTREEFKEIQREKILSMFDHKNKN